jgi:hypothetical protein
VARGAAPERFPFVQFEFAFPLGPSDGRYVTRAEAGGEPERIVVLTTVGAPRRSRLRRRPRKAEPGGGPAPVPTARATVIGLERLASDEEAARWLDALAGDDDAMAIHAAEAARELNAVLRFYRAAAADPHVRDVAPAGATTVRIGYGRGEEVADGRFTEAREVPPPSPRSATRKRAEALMPDERLAALLGRREEPMTCEELVLRARADLDAGRPREAALQARVALEAALAELPGAEGLSGAREDVARAANAALEGDPDPALQESVAAAVAAVEAALRRHRRA